MFASVLYARRLFVDSCFYIIVIVDMLYVSICMCVNFQGQTVSSVCGGVSLLTNIHILGLALQGEL